MLPTSRLTILGVVILIAILAVLTLLLLFKRVSSPLTWQPSQTVLKNDEVDQPQKILEVHLNYEKNKQPVIAITELFIKNGYPPRYQEPKSGFQLQTINDNQQIKQSLVFVPPTQIHAPPPLPEDKGKPVQPEAFTERSFILTLPFDDQASIVRVITEEGETLTTMAISKAQKIDNKPNYETLSAEQSFNWINTANAQANDNHKVDITFISHGYTDANHFNQDVDNFKNALLTYEPFTSRANDLLFHRLYSTANLNCQRSPSIDRLLYCDDYLAFSQLNSNAVPYDTVIIIVNDQVYGGSGGTTAVTYNGYYGPEVFVHELGHSFGKLLDEYSYGGDGGVLNQVNSNCYMGTPNGEVWPGVPVTEYRQSCSYDNWYRSSPYSIMLDLSSKYFNTVSQRLITREINYYATPEVYRSDINEDRNIDLNDYSMFLYDYQNPSPYYPKSDINQDGSVNILDYIILFQDYALNNP